MACGTSGGSPGTPQAESPTETEVDTVPPCAEISAVGALAAFAGSPCPWTLRPTGAGVELVHSTVPPMTRSGVMPEPCESLPCTFRGVETPVGPFVIVEVPGSGSEVPAGVWLGTVEGETLSFIDLWADAGEPVIDDGIELGPPHALAPFDCEGTLALFVQPRIPGARGLAPAPALRDREGPVASSAGALDRTRCEALPLHLP
ncbi:MAG: hypothetical protein ACE37F_33405 [Nannocystaceae bacterium]|nr:hypothetical protein [bacterium]